MKYGFITQNFGYCGKHGDLVDLAREAEDAGWDGFFLWDHIQFHDQEPTVDPWVALTAMAGATRRIRLGTLVTPVSRRRIAKLARETVEGRQGASVRPTCCEAPGTLIKPSSRRPSRNVPSDPHKLF